MLMLLLIQIWLSVSPDFVSSDWFINSLALLVDFKDQISLREHVFNLSSDNWIVNFRPFIDIFIIVRGSCKEGHIIDNVKSFKLVEDA